MVKGLRHALWALALVCAVRSSALTIQDSGNFGAKFIDDLRSLFGTLQQSDLDQAFVQAKRIRCSDLTGRSGWKDVAFLNEDRRLSNWSYDSISEVRSDPVRFVFSGICLSPDAPLQVATSFPIGANPSGPQKQPAGTQPVIRNNDPISAVFDLSEGSYIFRLPYLYVENASGFGISYTLVPPDSTTRPQPTIAAEFRCKAVSDTTLTNRFVICRTRIVDRDFDTQKANEALSRRFGNFAYYILSDGVEGTSDVNVTFGDVDANPNHL